MSQWYCKLDGAAAGPFAADELAYLARRGRLRADTEVRLAEERSWSPAGERLSALFPAAQPSAATAIAAADSPPAAAGQAAAPAKRPRPAPPQAAPQQRHGLIAAAIGALAAGLVLLALLLLLLSWRRPAGSGGLAGGFDKGVATGNDGRAEGGDLPADGDAVPATDPAPGLPSHHTPASPGSFTAPPRAPPTTESAPATPVPDREEPVPPQPEFAIARVTDAPAPAATGDERPPPKGAPDVRQGLTGRKEGKKADLLKEYGGTAGTEQAVEAGLAWLAKQQDEDGGWRLQGSFSNAGQLESRTAATAMALLAFQGAGHTHREGKYSALVERGWKFLLGRQQQDGSFRGEAGTLYAHAQATIALCEIYGMTHDEQFEEPAKQAVEYCLAAQADDGGWRYGPKMPGDMSVTGWFVMALQSARMAELPVPGDALTRVGQFLDACSPTDGVTYSYMAGGGPTPAMTAEALLCRQYLGWPRDDPRLMAGVAQLLRNPIHPKAHNAYYWYYATQVCHHMEGEAWKAWNRALRQELPKLQEKSGPEKGSWPPGSDHHAQTAGRLYETCLALYMLEVYYRHLPIYRYRPR